MRALAPGCVSWISVDAGGDPGVGWQGGGGADSGPIGGDDNAASSRLGADPRRQRSANHTQARHAGAAPAAGPGAAVAARRGNQQRDRGSVTVLVVFLTLIALALASLLVDVGTALAARERAADIAEQAARAGANDIDVAALRGGQVAIDTASACDRALTLVAAYGAKNGFSATGTCPAVSPQRITVMVSITTTPVIAVALGGFTVRASATAQPVCGITRGGQC